MTEVPNFLKGIVADIANQRRQDEQNQELERQYKEQVQSLQKSANSLLSEKGIQHTTHIGTGAGKDVVGYRLEQTFYQATQPIEIEDGDSKMTLEVVENVSGGPNYTIRHDSISIVLKEDGQGDKSQELFKIERSNDPNGITNWRGEKATVAELGLAQNIIDLIDSILPIPNHK